MKQLLIALLLITIIPVPDKAQNSCGVYRSFTDFQQAKISIPGNSKFGKKAIQVSDFFFRPYIYIKTDRGKHKISRDSVYAIRCSDGNVYRIWNEKAFLLVDTGFIKIYSYTSIETFKCKYSQGYRRRTQQVTRYFFSKNYITPILPLTLVNVRLALLTDEKIDAKLVLSFPDDKSLQGKTNNRFLINDFLNNQK